MADDTAETPLMPSPLEGRPSGRDMTELLRSPLYSLMPVAIDAEDESARQLPELTPGARPARRSRVLPLVIAALLGGATAFALARSARVSQLFRLPASLGLPALAQLSWTVDPRPTPFKLAPSDEPTPASPAAEAATEPALAEPAPARAEPTPAVAEAALALVPSARWAPKPKPAESETEKTEAPSAETTETPSGAARPEFDQGAATAALAEISSHLGDCADSAIGAITTRASVSFAPSGRATAVTVVPLAAMVGSPMVPCVVRRLRSATVPVFDGDPVTVHTTIKVE